VPELPEVEHAARLLRRQLVGRRVVAAWLDPRGKRLWRPATGAALARSLTGARVEAVARHGKQLLLTLSTPRGPLGVNAHLGMTGKWVALVPAEPAVRGRGARAGTRAGNLGAALPPHARLTLRLDDGRAVAYLDPRMFGRLRLVPGARFDRVAELGALGPDPMAAPIDLARLGARLRATRRPVKVALLDQSLLAGIGNIHASEACWRARLDPRRLAASLSVAEVARLARAVRASLRFGLAGLDLPEIEYLEEGGPNPFHVYDRAGSRCRHHGCGGTIQRLVQAQRSTYRCPCCQR
jgi:formamidopyrimidine-DNA glycosylase